MEIPTVLLLTQPREIPFWDTLLAAPPFQQRTAEDLNKFSTRFRKDIVLPTQLRCRNAAGPLTLNP